MKRLFKADTFFDDMPMAMEGYIDAAMDRHKELREQPSVFDHPDDRRLEQEIINFQRDQIGQLFKIQAKLEELLQAILEYEENDTGDLPF